MVLVYGDESMDETCQRVCAVAGIVGTEEQWAALQAKWIERNGGIPFHANQCESDQGAYRDNTHQENQALYKDLITLLADSGLQGYASSVDLVAQSKAFPKAANISQHTYYKVFIDVLEAMVFFAENVTDVAELTFDNRVQSNHNAALIYASLRESRPSWKEHLASKILFGSSEDNARIQVADLFAREAMKALDNVVGPIKRPIRKSWEALRDTQRFVVDSWGEDYFRDLLPDLKGAGERWGIRPSEYRAWLAETNRNHSMTAYVEYIGMVLKRPIV
jgi:hypothetical protein